MSDAVYLQCIRASCGARYDLREATYSCGRCGQLLDVAYDWARLPHPPDHSLFIERLRTRSRPLDFSGVWRFRELLPFAAEAEFVTIGEGQTILQSADVGRYDLALRDGCLFLQYEGLNPSGSFKDNGMAAAFTMARLLKRRRVACASTGNTSASLAMFAAMAPPIDGQRMQTIVFIGSGHVAFGKLAQALDHGALTLQIDGDFDDCMNRVREATERLGLYVLNSINPFRLEGQKAIMYRVLEGLDWQPPDWIVVPGGNLGNASAFGKAYTELRDLGLVDRIPRLAVVNATGANTLSHLYNRRGLRWNGGEWDEDLVRHHEQQMTAAGHKAQTVATAIQIGRPVNLPKALRSLDAMNGVVCEVTDEEILDEKARIGRAGFGCEPASAASVAGLRQLLQRGIVGRDDRVVCILTGHALKDPDATVNYHAGTDAKADSVGSQASGPSCVSTSSPPTSPPGRLANAPVRVANDLDAICRVIEAHS